MEDTQSDIQSEARKISEKEIIEYILQRFEDTKKSNKIKELVAFQTSNKYMIMVHDQIELKNLGNIVASYKKTPFSEIFQNYEEHLRIAMSKTPTTKSHTNVIMHIFGYISKYLSRNEQEIFFKMLQQFRENEITIGKTLSEINQITFHFDNTYLASQTYFLLYSDLQSGMIFDHLDKKYEINLNHKNNRV